MIEKQITDLITLIGFNNQHDFFRKVKGTDDIIVTDVNDFKLSLNNHISRLSLIDKSLIGNNTIENNKEKIIEEFEKFGDDFKWFIVRYNLPKIEYIYDNKPRIIGYSIETK